MHADQNFSAAELGLDELNPTITVDVGECYDDEGNVDASKFSIQVTVYEDFDFHVNLDRKYSSEPRIFEEDGSLTADAEAALNKLIKERYDGEYLEVEDEDSDPFFRFQLYVYVPADTTPEDLGTIIWEKTKLVQFHNEADPGTFGSPYLFGSLITDTMKQI